MNRVPYKFDINDGLVSLRGVVYLDDDALVIESRRAALDFIPLGRRTFRIPTDEIESIEVETGLVKNRLLIRPFSFEFLKGFPGDPGEEVAFPIARKHRDAAEALAREARLRNLPR